MSFYDDFYEEPEEEYDWLFVYDFVGESNKAWNLIVSLNKIKTNCWFPKSQCVYSDGKSKVHCPQWLIDNLKKDKASNITKNKNEE